MKLRHLFMAVIASAFAFTACEDEIDLGIAKLSVDPLELTFGPEGASKTVTMVATRDWQISGDLPDWIAVSPSSGKADTKEQTITVTVLENKGNDREAKINFTIGTYKAALTVKQQGEAGELIIKKGSGTKEDPFSVEGAIEYVKGLGANVESPAGIYVKGKISSVTTTFEASGSYGNATFDMVDTDESEEVFKAYQTYYLGNRKWKSGDKDVKAGDEVIVCGKVVLYKGDKGIETPETVGKGGSYIYSLNGETAEAQEVDYTKVPAKTVKEFIEAADTDNYYKLTGKVSKFSANYCSFDLTDESGTIYVYSVANKDEWSSKIKNDGTVTLAGQYEYYSAKSQHEVVNAVILSFEGGSGEEEDYSKAEAKTVAEFITLADTDHYYKLTGKVSKFNATYCSFDLTDASGTIYVYSVDNKADWSSKIKDGGTVVLAGKYAYYAAKEQHEVVNAVILSFEGDGNTNPPDDEQATGSGTLDSPFNPKAAYDAASKLEKDAVSDNDVYISGVISSIKYTFSAQYGTATFNISQDGSTNGTQFPCYSVYYLGNRAWVEGDAQVAVGDKVVICGKITNYGGNTPETASKKAYIYSLNGQTSIEQSAVFGVEKTEINVAATATGAVIKVTGNVPWTATTTAIIEGGSASGNGAGEFSVAFDANTDTENTKVYTVTVVTTADVDNKEIRVTITQAKASSSQGNHFEIQWLQEALAAAKDNNAVNQMDEVISFTNSSSYSGTVSELRIYKGKTLTIKAADGYTIEDIEIGCTASGTSNYGPGNFTTSPEGYTSSDKQGRWAGEAQEVVFTASSAQVRIVDLKVHYKN